jgi:large subunit ribosomal protein L9
MQIILMEKVINLGNLGDVVKVKDGYGRNYLIPRGKAKRVTEQTLKDFEAKRADLEKAAAADLAAGQAKGAKLDGFMLQITRKASEDGKLFGSVTNFDIAEALQAQGFEIERSHIRLPDGPLKQIGDQQLAIAVHPDVVVHITVSVLGEH